MAAATLVALNAPTDTNNMGGVKNKIYLALYSALATYAPLGADDISYTGNHVMAASAPNVFVPMFTMYDKSELEAQLVGSRLGKSFKTKVKLMFPALTLAALELVNNAKNQGLVALIPLANGTIAQLGDANFEASIVASKLISGSSPEAEHGMEIEIEWPSNVPYKIYSGTISQ